MRRPWRTTPVCGHLGGGNAWVREGCSVFLLLNLFLYFGIVNFLLLRLQGLLDTLRTVSFRILCALYEMALSCCNQLLNGIQEMLYSGRRSL